MDSLGRPLTQDPSNPVTVSFDEQSRQILNDDFPVCVVQAAEQVQKLGALLLVIKPFRGGTEFG